MNGNKVNLVSVLVAILVAVGALLGSFATHLSMLWGIPAMPRSIALQDPLGWALRPGIPPLAILGMLLVFVLLVGLTWLFVRLVVGSAAPGRGAAVFFGTWGALIVASMVAGVVRAMFMMVTLRIPTDNTDLVMAQFQQVSLITATWAVTWGWIAALVAALVHRSSTARRDGYGVNAPGTLSAPHHAQAAPHHAQSAPQQYVPQYAQTPPQQYAPQYAPPYAQPQHQQPHFSQPQAQPQSSSPDPEPQGQHPQPQQTGHSA